MKRAPPLVTSQLQKLVRDMRGRVPTLPTAAGRFAMVRDEAIYSDAFHTMKRGFELSVSLGSQVVQISRGEGLIFNILFGKPPRESSQVVVVPRDVDCREICAVAAMIEYRQAAASMQCVCVLHIKPFFLPIDIQHNQCPCRFFNPRRDTSSVVTKLHHRDTTLPRTGMQ